MVKRHTKFRHPVYKDQPFYIRHMVKLQIFSGALILGWLFIPMLSQFFYTPKSMLNPRNLDDIRELKKKYLLREKELMQRSGK